MNKNSSEKEITVTELAGMVMRGFERMENKMDHLEGRFDTLEGKVDSNHMNVNQSINWLTERIVIIMKFLTKRFQLEFPR